MTRRFGLWMIGTALGLSPLGGCAHWGQPTHHPNKTTVVETARPEKKHSPSENLPVELDQPTPIGPDFLRPLPAQTPASPLPKIDPQPDPLPTIPKVDTLQGDRPGLSPPVLSASLPRENKREPLVDALQSVLDNRPSEAVQFLRKYDQPTQEIFLRLLPILGLLTQKGIDQLAPPDVATLNEQARGLADTLRTRSKLAIDKACFCEWVESFGIYKPWPAGHTFLGSTSNRPGELVQLYVELRNFASEAKNGLYTTLLSSSVEIRDTDNHQIWYYHFHDEPIRSQAPLHDKFNNYSFRVPNNVPAGSYKLIITVKDVTHPDQPREASHSLDFRVSSMSARLP